MRVLSVPVAHQLLVLTRTQVWLRNPYDAVVTAGRTPVVEVGVSSTTTPSPPRPNELVLSADSDPTYRSSWLPNSMAGRPLWVPATVTVPPRAALEHSGEVRSNSAAAGGSEEHDFVTVTTSLSPPYVFLVSPIACFVRVVVACCCCFVLLGVLDWRCVGSCLTVPCCCCLWCLQHGSARESQ